LDRWVSRERSLQKFAIVADTLENCPGFASNKDVGFPCLRVRKFNCANHGQPIWLKLDEIAAPLAEFRAVAEMAQSLPVLSLSSCRLSNQMNVDGLNIDKLEADLQRGLYVSDNFFDRPR
jgi:hypothetical protein